MELTETNEGILDTELMKKVMKLVILCLQDFLPIGEVYIGGENTLIF
jgi:hypothetical protein